MPRAPGRQGAEAGHRRPGPARQPRRLAALAYVRAAVSCRRHPRCPLGRALRAPGGLPRPRSPGALARRTGDRRARRLVDRAEAPLRELPVGLDREPRRARSSAPRSSARRARHSPRAPRRFLAFRPGLRAARRPGGGVLGAALGLALAWLIAVVARPAAVARASGRTSAPRRSCPSSCARFRPTASSRHSTASIPSRS